VALVPAIPPIAFLLVLAGLLWIGLWRHRWRWWGAAPLTLGALLAFTAAPPDLLVTGDGKHLAVRTPAGELALLRPRAGDYVRDVLAELSGAESEFVDFDAAPAAACSDALCVYELPAAGRKWRILATRSRDLVRWDQMVAACAAADIVVSDRTLPEGCRPKWLKADRAALRQSGGLAFSLQGAPSVVSVADHARPSSPGSTDPSPATQRAAGVETDLPPNHERLCRRSPTAPACSRSPAPPPSRSSCSSTATAQTARI
jgi:competence protein ComEC